MVTCEEVDAWTAVAGWSLVLGTVISFVPQIVKIASNKDATGVSLAACWLVNMSALSSVICASLIDYQTFECCFGVGFMQCNNSLLSYYQILSRFVVVFPLYVLALLHHPSNPKNSHLREKNEEGEKELSLNRETAGDSEYDDTDDFEKGRSAFDWSKLNCFPWLRFWDMFVVLIVVTLFSTALTIFLIVSDVHYGTSLTSISGAIFGYISAVITSCIWIPQILYLYATKEQGSLSLLMFLVQAPGGLFIVYFQAILEEQPPSVWVGPLVAAIQQFVVCFQIIYYKIKNRRKKDKIESVSYEKLLAGQE